MEDKYCSTCRRPSFEGHVFKAAGKDYKRAGFTRAWKYPRVGNVGEDEDAKEGYSAVKIKYQVNEDDLYTTFYEELDRSSDNSVREMIGFKKLTAEGYAYAPRLKAISTGVNNTQVADPRAMPNGYIIYIFMDLLSGESLTRDKFDRCDKNEREEIRKALRAALDYIVDYDRLGTMKEDAIWYDHATTYTFWDVDERSEIDNDVSGDEEWFSCEEGPF